jgi:phospholipase A-2-activating protein
MASRKWEKVGEIVGGKDEGASGATLGKRLWEGKEYDYLFDIEINGAPLKLPFNRGDVRAQMVARPRSTRPTPGSSQAHALPAPPRLTSPSVCSIHGGCVRSQDPWMAAQQWIWKHDLDQSHLDAVANHLVANTPGNTPNAGYGNVDPFTSGGAYRPGAGSTGPVGSGGNADPYTSGGAYRPGPASAQPAGGGGGNADPFTSSGAYRPGPHPGMPPSGGTDPLSAKRSRPADASAAFATFDACKHDAVLGKLLQFNGQVAPLALDDVAIARLTAVVEALKAGPTSARAANLGAADVALFIGVNGSEGMLAWPTQYLFPALDLFRLVVLLPAAAAQLAAASPPLLPRLITMLTKCQEAGAADKPAAAATLMLLRACANMASCAELRLPVAMEASALLDTLNAPLEYGPANNRLAAATLLLNLTSLLAHGGAVPAEAALRSDAWTLQALSLLAFALALPAVLAEEETLHRLLAALASLVSGHAAASAAADTARELELPATLTALVLPPTASPLVLAAKERCLAALNK